MNRTLRISLLCALMLVTACGGSSDSTAPPMQSGATPPSITSQPSSTSVTVGESATFTVVAAGTAPLSYQWKKSGSAISGATSASYTTPATSASDNGATFQVVISNSAGSATSASVTLSVSAAGSAGSATDVTTFKNDVGRTGQNLTEMTLTPANVNSSSFGLLRILPADGKVDAQPLYLSQLTVANAPHNVLFAASENDSVYAYDADSGAALWHVSLLPTGEMTSDTHGCGQVIPQIGITSTPVIDRKAGPHGALFVVAMSLDSSSNYHQRLHALDVATGAELFGGPTDISATYTNSGGTTTFSPGQYEERAALLVANGLIYTAWTSHCDIAPYGGWIIAFSESTLARAATLNVAPGASGSGYASQGPAIWMAGDGPGADAAGNVYLLTGNGRFETTLDANGFPSLGDYGNSFLKIATSAGTMSVADYFTMSKEVSESAVDTDLGSGGEMLLPDLTDNTNTVRHLVVGAGKDGNLYLVNRDSLGKFSPSANNIWQEVDGALGGGVFASPAYFNGMLYYGAVGSNLQAYKVQNARIIAPAASHSSVTFPYPGTSPAVSANGTANAIVWAHENSSPAVLHAYDATNLADELYNSNQASGARDQFGTGNKFITPMISGGKVFVGTTSGVAVFGLLH
ncbi:MAG TPA: immunoglobulin domain-containing protein [Steroidobacteraceae bacterium]